MTHGTKKKNSSESSLRCVYFESVNNCFVKGNVFSINSNYDSTKLIVSQVQNVHDIRGR